MHVLFGNYPLIAGLSFVGAWLTLEMQGYALTPQKVGPFWEKGPTFPGTTFRGKFLYRYTQSC